MHHNSKHSYDAGRGISRRIPPTGRWPGQVALWRVSCAFSLTSAVSRSDGQTLCRGQSIAGIPAMRRGGPPPLRSALPAARAGRNAVLLCCCAAMLMCCCAAVLLCCCAAALLRCCAAAVLSSAVLLWQAYFCRCDPWLCKMTSHRYSKRAQILSESYSK